MLRSLTYLLAAVTALPLWAAELRVPPAVSGGLAQAIAGANSGDVLILEPGRHKGPLIIDRPLTLTGSHDAVIDGLGKGTTITIDAPDVTIKGLTVTGSGLNSEDTDAGIKILKKADRALVENNRVLGNLHGIDVHGGLDAVVRGNTIEGTRNPRMNDRGNGIYVWNAPGARVEQNSVRFGRDGIFVNSSRENTFSNNRFEDLRFAVHYMYANNSEVSDNISIGNHLGYAIMYSRNVQVTGNVSVGDRDHGVMLNYTNDSHVSGNYVREGAEKCLFVYNAHKNQIEGNRFERCDMGIHFTAGSERNAVLGNAFVGNRTQVKYVSTKWLDWAENGRGNYWSDFVATDFDGDGIADATYRPNDSMDHILWSQPAAKLLLGAPAVQLVRWAQDSFPALMPGGVMDSAPLMRPVQIEIPEWERGAYVN